MATVGQLPEFQLDNKRITDYLGRVQLFYKAYGSRAKTSSCLTDHSWRQDIRPTQQPSGAKQTEYEEL